MTVQETASLLKKMSGVFTRISQSDAAIDVWQEILQEIPYEKCNQAFMMFLRDDGQREPRPGDILRISKSIYEPIVHYEKQPCYKCRSTGIVFIIDQFGHESVGSCDCINGAQHVGLPKIRRFNWNMDQLGRVKVTNYNPPEYLRGG